MDKDVTAFLKYWQTLTDISLWDLVDSLDDEKHFKALSTIFTPQQAVIIKIIINQVVKALDFHETFENSHIKINAEIRKLQAQFRNHRHDFSKAFTGKTEY